jgi:hypothetical protein
MEKYMSITCVEDGNTVEFYVTNSLGSISHISTIEQHPSVKMMVLKKYNRPIKTVSMTSDNYVKLFDECMNRKYF